MHILGQINISKNIALFSASVRYVYDELDNIKEIWYNVGGTESKAYEYIYTSYGQLARFDNLITGKTTLYRYDGARRLITTVEYDTADMKNDFSVNLEYNENSQLHDLYYVLNYAQGTSSAENMTSYVYFYTPEGDLSSVSVGASVNDFFVDGDIDYSYDAFKRLTGKTYSFGSYTNSVSYGYKAGADSNSTTALVNTYTSTVNGTSVTYNYTYDNNGNITKITRSDGIEYRYVYDDLGQLIREDNTKNSATYVYTYDNAGNILTKSTYALTAEGTTPTNPISTINYGYDDASWGDLLTSYNGTSITYDAIGNPLSYYNGISYTMTWTQGRRLASMTRGSSTTHYTYNDEGIRTSKTVNGVTHTYHLSGSQIIAEEIGNELFIYMYDADGSPIGMQYRNTTYADGVFDVYWYEKNLQGDIVAIYDNAGNRVGWYFYDAWGNARVYSNSAATSVYARRNPFRYRGYYYDSESGFYYLNSRYYDPATGRFISADGEMSGADTSLHGKNLFAYCFNNPVNLDDSDGNWPKWVKKTVAAIAIVAVVATVAAITVATAGGGTAAAVIAVGAAKGAAIGMASGAVIGAATGAISHRASTGSWEGAGEAALNGMADGALSGAVSGAITGAAGSALKVGQAAKAWNGVAGKNISPYQDMVRHYQRHVLDEGQRSLAKNILKYTDDAVSFFNNNSSSGYALREGVVKISGAPGGIFTTSGKILSFWYCGK